MKAYLMANGFNTEMTIFPQHKAGLSNAMVIDIMMKALLQIVIERLR